MNKKQIMKEQKRIKQERRQAEKMFADDNGVMNTVKITVGVLLFILISFAVINIAKGNWNLFSKKNQTITPIDSSMVIVGTMFKDQEEDYLVLAYDMKGIDKELYSYLAQNYGGTLDLYYLDLSSGFNSMFIGDTPNITNDLSQFRLSGPTLLVISNKQIKESYTEQDAIMNYLNSK